MVIMDYIRIGKFIKMKRQEKGFTQYTLAEKLYISREAVSKWERGVSIPDTQVLIRLAEILGVTTNDILLIDQNLTKKEAVTIYEE